MTVPCSGLLDTQIKAVQQFYAEQMDAHGYGRKTFQIETDSTGTLIVHHFIGFQNDAYYHTATLQKVHSEINTRFDTDKEVYVAIVDMSSERIEGNCEVARYEGGPVFIPASGECLEGDEGIDLIAHELGHAFNLLHDFRDDTHIMSYGYGSIFRSVATSQYRFLQVLMAAPVTISLSATRVCYMKPNR